MALPLSTGEKDISDIVVDHLPLVKIKIVPNTDPLSEIISLVS